jgi:hypothetical protein
MSFTVPQTVTTTSRTHVHSGPAYQAYQILHVAFTIAPIIAGLDKFFDKLCNWDKYLSDSFANLSPFAVHPTMQAIGIIEVVAGLIVVFRPRIGAYIVAIWLIGIIINLLLIPAYFDVALRDLGLCLGALALGRLSQEFAR